MTDKTQNLMQSVTDLDELTQASEAALVKHTGGQWKAEKDKFGNYSIVYRGDVIAHIDTDGLLPKEENEANARLIAAAPELLQALKDVVALNKEATTQTCDRNLEGAARIAQAAINKAEGRS